MIESVNTDFQLYHYTTQQGLLGILENNCLWATHYKFLNDYSEIVKFKEKLIEYLEPHILESQQKINFELLLKEGQKIIQTEDKDLELAMHYVHSMLISINGAKGVCEEQINAVYGVLPEIYISSFCKEHYAGDAYINENGLLSQWRAYSEDGGFAIVLNKSDLQNRIDIEEKNFSYKSIFIENVIYSDEEVTNEQKNHLENIKNLFLAFLEKKDADDYWFHSLINFMTRYKDCGFKEEKEIRIVALPLLEKNNKNKNREFRFKNGEQIPYIELFKSKKLTLPIKKIIVGPHKNKEARAAWLQIKLANMGRADIEVTVSKIPFVGR